MLCAWRVQVQAVCVPTDVSGRGADVAAATHPHPVTQVVLENRESQAIKHPSGYGAGPASARSATLHVLGPQHGGGRSVLDLQGGLAVGWR